MNNDLAYNSRYGLQELEQLTQDHESDDVLRRRLRRESLVENVEFMESVILKSNVGGSGVKGFENSRKANGNDQYSSSFENTHHASHLTMNDGSSTSVLHLKSVSKGKWIEKDASDGVVEENKDANTEPSTPVSVRRSRSNFTVPQPFNLSTQRRHSIGDMPRNGKSGQEMQKSMGFRGEINSKAHFSRNLEPKQMLQANNNREVSRQFPFHDKLEQDDDVVSVSSIQSRQNTQTPKANASKFTNTNVFKLQSDTRAEKRKEFYSKLQEKLNAKEEMKTHLQAKTKELDDEIKVLRKRLVFRASPLPSFYQEGHPHKVELPKVPPTQAKSPNFSRRHSISRSSSRPCDLLHCEAGHNNFKCLHRHDTSVNNSSSSFRSLPGSTHEKSTPKYPSITRNLKNVDEEARESDAKIKMKDQATISPLPVSSDLILSNEEEQDHVAKVEIKQVATHSSGNTKNAQRKNIAIPAVFKSQPNIQIKGRNESNIHLNTDNRRFLPTTSKIQSDGNDSEESTNKSAKKETPKGITSFFTSSRGIKSAKSFSSSTQTPENTK